MSQPSMRPVRAVIRERFVIHHRQRAGQPEAGRTSVRVRLRTKFHRTTAKHFRTRLELHVNFQTDGDDVIRHSKGESDGTTNFLFPFHRVIQRLLELERFHLGGDCGVIRGFDQTFILEQVHELSVRDHIGNLRVSTQCQNFRILA